VRRTRQLIKMPAKVILTIIEGSLKGQEFVIDSRTTCIMGRAKDCHPQIPDDEHHRTISRYHCLLDINPPDIRVRDFGSLNGTYVNGKKIGQRQINQTPEEGAKLKFPEYDLKKGDLIKLGNTVFRIQTEAANEEEFTRFPDENPLADINSGDLSNFKNIEGYTILTELGRAGCSTIYVARHKQTRDLVAIKLMLPQVAINRRARDWFLRQVENTKALHHPNIVQLRDYGYGKGTFFCALEYCKDGNIFDLMRKRNSRLSIDEGIAITMQVLDGLDYAHHAEIPYTRLSDGTFGKGRGLIHRDIKPHNILLTYSDKKLVAKIADYGLSKAFDLAGFSGQTMSGNKAGTPGFIPRQQVLNFKYGKPDLDVWTTAACLYFMLTGFYPRDFTNKDPFLVVLQTPAIPIRRRNSDIPVKLAEVIDLALVDNPQITFKSAVEFKQALLSVL
jgi:eukaryotic-like serine/threonine-protein kinase